MIHRNETGIPATPWRLLAEGTLEELRERHGERDLEEIFVKVAGGDNGGGAVNGGGEPR